MDPPDIADPQLDSALVNGQDIAVGRCQHRHGAGLTQLEGAPRCVGATDRGATGVGVAALQPQGAAAHLGKAALGCS